MQKVLSYHQAQGLLSTTEKVGQLFMPAAFINDTEAEIAKLELLILNHHIGGLCFFHSRASAATNYEGKKKVVYNEKSFETLKSLIRRYQKAATYPLLIAIDAEWGLAMRIENTPQYPYAITLGAIRNDNDLIFQVGKNIAQDCKIAGIHLNFSPVADINNNPNNPVIGYRSFGENRDSVAEKGIALMKGMQSMGILTSAKHFPGHGDTATDSHLGLPVIEKSKSALLANELFPFQKLIEAGVDSVMVGHLSVPSLTNGKNIASSISKDSIKGVLRNEMGFEGVVVSDAMNMHAISKLYHKKGQLEWAAFDAGNDILCFAEHVAEGAATILKNAHKSQIEDSFKRIWGLKEKAFGTAEKLGSQLTDPYNLNKRIALKSLTLHQGTEEDIKTFRDHPVCGIQISQDIDNQFFKSINKNNTLKTLSIVKSVLGEAGPALPKEEFILLALFPPQVKPVNNFGFSKDVLTYVNKLIHNKKVVLYLFGNPYVLNHIHTEKAHAVVIAYQNFKVFQEVAADHFMGLFKAVGELPIKLAPHEGL
ncbi:MAG: glycoside hydrolase family 3 protein [Maribacter sp.]|nr:glycoside hydrolase family 3 protein [Maribacter sp.]